MQNKSLHLPSPSSFFGGEGRRATAAAVAAAPRSAAAFSAAACFSAAAWAFLCAASRAFCATSRLASRFAASGVPGIVCGPGSIQQAHTRDEWLEVAELEQAAEIYYRFCSHAV